MILRFLHLYIIDIYLASVAAWPRAISWHYKAALTGGLRALTGSEGDCGWQSPCSSPAVCSSGERLTRPCLSWACSMCRAYAPSAMQPQKSCSPRPIPKLTVVRYKLFALCCSVPSPIPVLVADTEKTLFKGVALLPHFVDDVLRFHERAATNRIFDSSGYAQRLY